MHTQVLHGIHPGYEAAPHASERISRRVDDALFIHHNGSVDGFQPTISEQAKLALKTAPFAGKRVDKAQPTGQ